MSPPRRDLFRRVSTRLIVLWKTGRLLAAAAVAGVLIYSIAVLVSVAGSGNLGLRCVLGVQIIDVHGRDWLMAREEVPLEHRVPQSPGVNWEWSPRPPSVGMGRDDRNVLIAVGNKFIRESNYHDYVLACLRWQHEIGKVVEVGWRTPSGRYFVGQVHIEKPPLWTYFWSCVWFVQEMVVFALGTGVFWKRPRDESARLFFWLCVVTVGAFMAGYHWPQIVMHRALIYPFPAFAVFVPILNLHFYLVFPRVNPLFRRHRRVLTGVLYSIPLLSLAAIWAFMYWSANDEAHVQEVLALLRFLALGYIRFSAVVFLLCLVCLVQSFVRARDHSERNQVQWILLATLLSLLPISYLLWDTWFDPARLGLSTAAWPMMLVSLFYTLAYAISITRYKLMQAGVFLGRGVIYFLVSMTAGLLYSGGLVITAMVIGDQLLAERTTMRALVAGLTAIVILFFSEVARHQFQRALDRRFHREKYTFDQALNKMSQAVGSLADRGMLGRCLLEAATEVLRIDWAAIYLRGPGGGPMALVACHGPEPDDRVIADENPLLSRLLQATTFRVPHSAGPAFDPAAADALIALGGEMAVALHGDGLAGVIVLGPKRSGLPYQNEETAFLGALASVASLAVRSADIQTTLEVLNQELHDKVEKIAEQRRRILVLQNQLAGRWRDEHARRAEVEAADAGPAPLPPPETDGEAFQAIKGSGPAMRKMVALARKVATSSSAVLIRGESGTGKELLAEAIHKASKRAGKPFVKVNCAALSQTLLESELFGHVKSAFTGADRDRVGRFQLADGGTLFLDEIGDISWEVQTKLLRVLQQKEFERVGSSQTIAVDVRIIAATHRDLEALIRAGKFREDLFYRLNVITLRTPALRERREDIFELAVHFLNVHSRRAGKDVMQIDEAAIEALMAYEWPGNIRELENVIEGAVVLTDGLTVTLEDLPVEVRRPPRRRRAPSRAAVTAVAAVGVAPSSRSIDDAVEEDEEFLSYERQRLLDALRDANGNKSSAARLLAIPRSTFFSKLRKHGLA